MHFRLANILEGWCNNLFLQELCRYLLNADINGKLLIQRVHNRVAPHFNIFIMYDAVTRCAQAGRPTLLWPGLNLRP